MTVGKMRLSPRALVVAVVSAALFLVAGVQTGGAVSASDGAADPGEESGWRNAEFGGVLGFKVMADWELTATDTDIDIYTIVPETGNGGDASFLAVENMGDRKTLKELAEIDMRNAKENASEEAKIFSRGLGRLGELRKYEWTFNQSPSLEGYYLYVEKEGFVYRFSFRIANGCPENFDVAFSEFKANLAHENWGDENGIAGLAVAIIGIVAIVLAIGTGNHFARRSEKKMEKGHFAVKQMIAFPIASFAFLGFGLFMFAGVLLIDNFNAFDYTFDFSGIDAQTLTALIPCSIFTGIGLFLACISMRWRIIVSEDEAVYTPFLGRARTIRLKDCKLIRTTASDPGFAVYDKNNKKVLSASAYCRGYVLLADAISPYVRNAWEIPRPAKMPAPKRTGPGGYRRGKHPEDIGAYLMEYSRNEIGETETVKCHNCGFDAFALKMNDAGNAIEIECARCKGKRLLPHSMDCREDCEPMAVDCPNCKQYVFKVVPGLVCRDSGIAKRVCVGVMCTHCGLLGCPADWQVSPGEPTC